MDLAALIAALAATVAIGVHGVIGHRWFTAQLRAVELQPSSLFGDAEMSPRVFAVAWHAVTAMFVCTAATLYLVAFEAVESRELLRFISILHAAILVVGGGMLSTRLDALKRPVPPVFVASMLLIAIFAWVSAG